MLALLLAVTIPLDAMTETNRVLVRAVTEHVTLRREYGARRFTGRVSEFEWLLDHLDACSVLAERAGLLKYRAVKHADGRYYADNREGAAGLILPVFAETGCRIYYVEGREQGLFSVAGRGVAVIAYRQAETNVIEYTGASLVRVDNGFVAAVARVFAVFLRGAVDYHYDHVMGHPIRLSGRATTEREILQGHIAAMSEADRKLLEPFETLLARPGG
jgi:hypothetical protein